VAGLAALVVTSFSAGAAADVVTLKDGTKIDGRIVTLHPGKDVVVELADATRRTIEWADVREIELPPAKVATPETAPPPPLVAPAPPPGKTGAADGKGKGKKKKKKDTSTTNVDLDPNNPNATFHGESDCSESEDEDCTAVTDGSIGKGGVGLSYSEESVKDVDKPKHGSTNFALSASAIGGFGDNITMVGGNAALSVRMLMGSQFPGKTGGSWFGVFLEPTFSGGGTAITIKIPAQCFPTGFGGSYCTTATKQTDGAGIIISTMGAGLQWMYFGSRDAKTKKQSGFGIALGGVVGYQKTFAKGDNSPGSATYGPQLSFLFPSYNAGTTSFSSFQLNFFVLPTKDFVLVLGGLQYSFG
jgi:hypothetical protein